MVYFNSDGNESTMRETVGDALLLLLIIWVLEETNGLEVEDGYHKAQLTNDDVSIEMIPVNQIELYDTHVFMNTGSPHHIELVDNALRLMF